MTSINERKEVIAVAVFTREDGSKLHFRAENELTREGVRSSAKQHGWPYYERINGRLTSVKP